MMRRRLIFLARSALAMLFYAGPVLAQAEGNATQVFAKNSPAVVTIQTPSVLGSDVSVDSITAFVSNGPSVIQLSPLVRLAYDAVPTQSRGDNSNLWPVHRDVRAGFRISHPPDWIVVPPKGVNIRFSFNPPTGAGNCNVMARTNPELDGLTQAALNEELESLPNDSGGWASYVGLRSSQVYVVESRRTSVQGVSGLFAVLETSLENLEGNYMRKQIASVMLTPGLIWSLNCGVSVGSSEEAQARFAELQPNFMQVFGSFAFLAQDATPSVTGGALFSVFFHWAIEASVMVLLVFAIVWRLMGNRDGQRLQLSVGWYLAGWLGTATGTAAIRLAGVFLVGGRRLDWGGQDLGGLLPGVVPILLAIAFCSFVKPRATIRAVEKESWFGWW